MVSGTRLQETEHTSRPWRIHELTRDFRVEDVWQLPCQGDAHSFHDLVAMIVSQDVSRSSSRAVRSLFALREKLGALLHWDSDAAAARSPDESLLERLPPDLREAPAPGFAALPFTSLYLLDHEFAAEMANRTVHGVLHLGWVPNDAGGFRGQMAVLVNPNGLLGAAYMAAIRPFRHYVVYPALMEQWERAWRRLTGSHARQVPAT